MSNFEADEADNSRPMRVTRQFSIPKRPGEANEDRALSSVAPGILAVSDGASVSFDPGTWAQILVEHFTADQNVTVEWLTSAANEYRAKYDRENMEWMLQAAFDRGSFATLLGIATTPDQRSIKVTAVGDSLCVVADSQQLVASIPLLDPSDFEKSPTLLSTSYAENQVWTDETLDDCKRDIDIAGLSDPKVLLMTDAIGKWLLEDRDDRLNVLLGLNSEEEFSQFVELERTEQRMRRDDSTLVILERARELPADH
ncbi:MAG: hypothetical protein KIT15_12440 [Xanthobacteraceae bacterium]|nr:hypothetical protein [Xanthobacteraceae bacterium]